MRVAVNIFEKKKLLRNKKKQNRKEKPETLKEVVALLK